MCGWILTPTDGGVSTLVVLWCGILSAAFSVESSSAVVVCVGESVHVGG